MFDDERPDAPDEGAAPEDEAGTPADAPSTADAAEPSPSADPGEAPTAGDEDLEAVEDATEQVSDAPTEEPAAEPAAEEPTPEPAADADAPSSEPAVPEPAADADAPSSEPAVPEPAADAEAPAAEAPAADAPAPDAPAAEEAPGDRPRREKRDSGDEKKKEDVVPGAHLEPDLVLEEAAPSEVDEYADPYAPAAEDGEPADAEAPAADAEAPAERPAPRTALDLAADARYLATGKRKTSVARVILKPGDGAYSVNGRSLEDYFPRAALQKAARSPLQTAGFEKRMDVTAKIHGGGISAQAGALRHGVARALVEADPSLRLELKRRGFLSRDARAKERKKAGLKKARKRPQFSKR